LVHDADKIDLYLQALVYEQQSGNEYLQEFWVTEPSFYFSQSLTLYETIKDRRRAGP
jgi:5'-deoxynucleotidase YfbR-like HD superfamily hydrolase